MARLEKGLPSASLQMVILMLRGQDHGYGTHGCRNSALESSFLRKLTHQETINRRASRPVRKLNTLWEQELRLKEGADKNPESQNPTVR